jgi:thioredoxin reductase
MTDLIGHIDILITMTKAVLDVHKNFNDTAFKKQIADITDEFAEFKTKAAKLESDYAALLEENRELKSQRQEDIDNPLTVSTPSGISFDTCRVPYCTGCHKGPTQRRIPLAYKWANSVETCYYCPHCDKEYKDVKDISPRPPQRVGWDPLDF